MMKRIVWAIILFCWIFPVFGEQLAGKVIRIADGDTITILLQGQKKQEKVRFFGIDAPESHQDFGQRSRKFLSDLIFGRIVIVESDGRDQYGRIVGTVYLGKLNVNLTMVKNGYAWHYVAFAKNNKELAEAEALARREKRGLWKLDNPIPPWEFRKIQGIGRQNKKEAQ